MYSKCIHLPCTFLFFSMKYKLKWNKVHVCLIHFHCGFLVVEKKGQQPTAVRQTSQHGSPPGKTTQQPQRGQQQPHPQQLKNSPQHAGHNRSPNSNQSGQPGPRPGPPGPPGPRPGPRPGLPDGDSRRVERIDDGTAAMAASKNLRDSRMAAGAQFSNDDSDALGDLGKGEKLSRHTCTPSKLRLKINSNRPPLDP